MSVTLCGFWFISIPLSEISFRLSSSTGRSKVRVRNKARIQFLRHWVSTQRFKLIKAPSPLTFSCFSFVSDNIIWFNMHTLFFHICKSPENFGTSWEPVLEAFCSWFAVVVSACKVENVLPKWNLVSRGCHVMPHFGFHHISAATCHFFKPIFKSYM